MVVVHIYTFYFDRLIQYSCHLFLILKNPFLFLLQVFFVFFGEYFVVFCGRVMESNSEIYRTYTYQPLPVR